MELRVLDELFAPEGRGVVLIAMDDEGAALLKPGMTLVDALGGRHVLKTVTRQEDGLYTLHLPQADPAYFERLFRNVRVDATLLSAEGAPPCP